MLRRGSKTFPRVALTVGVEERMRQEDAQITAKEKCSKSSAQAVESIPKFHLNPVVIDLYTVAIASAKTHHVSRGLDRYLRGRIHLPLFL